MKQTVDQTIITYKKAAQESKKNAKANKLSIYIEEEETYIKCECESESSQICIFGFWHSQNHACKEVCLMEQPTYTHPGIWFVSSV